MPDPSPAYAPSDRPSNRGFELPTLPAPIPPYSHQSPTRSTRPSTFFIIRERPRTKAKPSSSRLGSRRVAFVPEVIATIPPPLPPPVTAQVESQSGRPRRRPATSPRRNRLPTTTPPNNPSLPGARRCDFQLISCGSQKSACLIATRSHSHTVMFVSPCTLRSTQCAALIALAAVAGIARVETTHPNTSVDQSPSLGAARQSSQIPDHLVVYASSTSIIPYLHPVATVALWFSCGTNLDAKSEPSPATAPSLPANAHYACVPLPSAFRLPDATVASAGLAHPFPPRPALCTGAHVIPFAVGPPPRDLDFTHRPVGTCVPADDTVRCSLVSPFARSFSRFIARLACPEFSGRPLFGPSFSPSSALRGKPARLSASSTLRPSLGASARPGHGSLPVLT